MQGEGQPAPPPAPVGASRWWPTRCRCCRRSPGSRPAARVRAARARRQRARRRGSPGRPAHRGVTGVGPDADAVRPAGRRVDVVADALLVDVVAGVRAAQVAERAGVRRRPGPWRAAGADRGVAEHAVVGPRRRSCRRPAMATVPPRRRHRRGRPSGRSPAPRTSAGPRRATRSTGPSSRPAVASTSETRLLVVERRRAVGPGVHDLVGRAGAGRRAVGDVDARRCGQVGPRAGEAVHDAAAVDRVDEEARVGDLRRMSAASSSARRRRWT